MSSDADGLFDLYANLQDLMKHHVAINEVLKEMSITGTGNFELIEKASAAIIDRCVDIESSMKPKCHQCCCRQT